VAPALNPSLSCSSLEPIYSELKQKSDHENQVLATLLLDNTQMINWENLNKRMKPLWEQLFEELAANDERKIVWLKDNRGKSALLIHRRPTIHRK
jgi:hypothetical protein